MKLAAYHTPKTLDETLAVLDAEAKQGREAALLAGGTDVMVRMREGRMAPQVLIQIEALAELVGIEDLGQSIRIGARTSFTQIIESGLIREHAAVLSIASREVGAPQIQTRGTIGGQLGTASPVGDAIPPLLVLDAEVIARSVDGERRVPLAQWLKGVGICDRRPNEIITAVEFPKLPSGTHSLWHKLGPRRAQSISKVCFAGVVHIEAGQIDLARFAYGAVAITAVRAPEVEALVTGQGLTPDLIGRAAALIQSQVKPITDIRSTEDYRRKMCGVMLKRGLASILDAD